ncbi:hypothetical protein EWM64_g2095 [Hericium alpestre]|uniref:Uncharacterized protein n=1 Tax=Hericium alpestre TaxID=135208 RepID=A0A4Z0A5B4_9AGAM|nr:hypothetical protein EWM64_g2095 [Hericium alpestre]
MPSIAFHSVVPVDVDGFSLTINVIHTLFVDAPSEIVHTWLQPLPPSIDVHLLSDLVFSIAGIVDGQPVPPNQLTQSAVLRHLRTYLRINSVFLGVNTISQVFSEELDGIPKCLLLAWALSVIA